MNRVLPNQLATFLRPYRLPGGRIKGVTIAHHAQRGLSVLFHLVVRESIQNLDDKPGARRLKLRLDQVEEYRFQMRPNQPRVRIADARISHLGGLFYLNLDAWSLEAGEQPKVYDFRASEVYAAGKELWVEDVTPKA